MSITRIAFQSTEQRELMAFFSLLLHVTSTLESIRNAIMTATKCFFCTFFCSSTFEHLKKKEFVTLIKTSNARFSLFLKKINFSPPSRDYSQMIGHVSGNIQQVRRVDNTSETCDFVFVIFCEREEKMSDEL